MQKDFHSPELMKEKMSFMTSVPVSIQQKWKDFSDLHKRERKDWKYLIMEHMTLDYRIQAISIIKMED